MRAASTASASACTCRANLRARRTVTSPFAHSRDGAAFSRCACRAAESRTGFPHEVIDRRSCDSYNGCTRGTPEDVVRKHIQVLLIEDDTAIADLYGGRLIRDGYAVAFARDGEEGLQMARAEAPNLIYLDVRLPKVDGLTVLRELRNDPASADVPVVMLTNYDDPEVRSTGLELGARLVLLKSETTPAQLSSLTAEWIAA